MTERTDVSIIIVNYNCADYISNCLSSIYDKTTDIDFEIIVVDNNSTDNSLEIVSANFPLVKIIRNADNKGFGAANNVGAAVARGTYLLLLNPDTILINNVARIFYDYAKNSLEKVGCIGGTLLDGDKKPANLGGNFPSLKQIFSDIGFRSLYKKYYTRNITLLLTSETVAKTGEIDCVCGADLFIAKKVFDGVGGFDEDYFLYYEDTDLCFRLKKKGYKNFIELQAKLIHLESVVTKDGKRNKINLQKFKFIETGKQLFFRKSYGTRHLAVARFLTVFYLLSRSIFHKIKISEFVQLVKISLNIKTRA